MEEKKRYVLLIWTAYLIIFVACAVIDLAVSLGLSWVPWVWAGLGIGFAISTANLILKYTTCSKCGKMIKTDDMYCSKCGVKSKMKFSNR